MPNQIAIRRPFRKRGQNWLPSTSLLVGSATGSGGVEFGGAATVAFVHAGSVASDIVVQWDFDNDSDFSESVEDITTYVRSLETFTGRDWPSLLTGKAGPGKFKATLDNSDNRFNYFNTASPLVTTPFSLRVGRKLRVKVSGASNPDPTLLAKDRFRRTMGALGSDETGKTYVEPLTNDLTIFSNRAVASSEGNPHIAVVDTGATDYYVQTKVAVLGDSTPANRVGVVYRYVDSNDYSLCVIDGSDSSVKLIDVVSGVETTIAGTSFEVYSGITVGVLVSGAVATAYVEGVIMATGAAINGTAELVGMYAQWVTGDSRPELDEFFSWTGIPTQQEGILWTGDVSELQSSVAAGPDKAALVAGEGWLSKLSTQEITPPASLTGRSTGLLTGYALAKALQIHPPILIDRGDVSTGTFAMPERSALAVARDVEEVEFGFLYETQEGYLSFRDRTHRDALTSQVTMSDAVGTQFGYHRLDPYDWNKEVFNRVLAGVSPWTEGSPAVLYTDPGPYNIDPGGSATISATYDGIVVRWAGSTYDLLVPGGDPSAPTVTADTQASSTTHVISLPATVTAGDLLLITIGVSPPSGSGQNSWNGTPPAGWTVITSGGKLGIIAKVADGTEDGTTITLTGTGTLDWAAHVHRVVDWFGSLDKIEITERVYGLNTNPNGPAIPVSWGAVPSLVISFFTADYAGGSAVSSVPTDYTSGAASALSQLTTGSAYRIQTNVAPNPSQWTVTNTTSWAAITIAIAGSAVESPQTSTSPTGADGTFTIAHDPGESSDIQTIQNIQVTGVPLVEGDQTFAQADDYDSQDDHNGIRTYQASASLFATPADAETYADLVLSKFADDRPILAISFYASKSPAYRAQALRRRVGDKITLVANANSGMGISADFFIESINHRWSNGNTLWETTWELSPA